MRHALRATAVSWAAVFSAGSPAGVLAQRYESLYDDSVLAHWRPIYGENLRWNLERVVWRALPAGERARIGPVRIAFPLRDPRADPVAYTSSDSSDISLSALSVRFLHDLAVAEAWLSREGFSTASVIEYLTALRVHPATAFPDGRYPAPLAALGVPAAAPGWASLREAADRTLKGASVFLLAHQLGHFWLAAGSRRLSDPRTAEVAADSFALAVFRNLGVAPHGLPLLFRVAVLLTPHAGDFQTDSLWLAYHNDGSRHLISQQRLTALAQSLHDDPRGFALREPNFGESVRAVRVMADALLAIAGRIDESGAARRSRAGVPSRPPRAVFEPR